ncbi:MAG: peptidylprolyl isomerase [Oscillospiraceae bacterium]|nr:peptidylprolyl isomerase [Oscillospiraceae bacterium]
MKRFFAVFLAAMLLISAFAGCSSEKAPEETGGESPVAIKIGNTEFTVEDVDYMYVTTFNDMYNYYASTYGNYISAIIDITKPLDEQMIDETTSWHQYIVDYTVNSLKSFTGIYEKAIAEGFVLPEEYQADLDTLEQQLDEIAVSAGMTREEYLSSMYGGRVGIETVKKMTEFRYLVASYAEAYEAEIEVAAEDIEAYYNSNKQNIDTVDFRFYSSYYEDPAEETETEETTEEKEKVLTQEEAKAQADALAAVHTAEEFNALAKEFTTDEEQKKLFDEGDATLFAGAGYSSTGIEEVSKWLFDESRKQGDTFIHHDEDYNSYLTIMFEQRVDPDYDYIDVRHILIMPEENEEGTKTDEAWAEAEAKANEIYDGYLAGEQTEEAFAALAVEHSQDGNASRGGIYENVKRGQMVPTFNDWCFDETRVPGDSGIVKTPYGYHIMYFSGTGDNNLVSLIEPAVKSERVDAWVVECSAELKEERTEEFDSVGGMIDEIVAAANEAAGNEPTAEEEKEVKSYTGIIIGVLIAIIFVCIIIIIKNVKKKPEQEEMTESEETEESVLEATDEDLTEEELLAEEAFEENPSEEEAEEVSEETEE